MHKIAYIYIYIYIDPYHTYSFNDHGVLGEILDFDFIRAHILSKITE